MHDQEAVARATWLCKCLQKTLWRSGKRKSARQRCTVYESINLKRLHAVNHYCHFLTCYISWLVHSMALSCFFFSNIPWKTYWQSFTAIFRSEPKNMRTCIQSCVRIGANVAKQVSSMYHCLLTRQNQGEKLKVYCISNTLGFSTPRWLRNHLPTHTECPAAVV